MLAAGGGGGTCGPLWPFTHTTLTKPQLRGAASGSTTPNVRPPPPALPTVGPPGNYLIAGKATPAIATNRALSKKMPPDRPGMRGA